MAETIALTGPARTPSTISSRNSPSKIANNEAITPDILKEFDEIFNSKPADGEKQDAKTAAEQEAVNKVVDGMDIFDSNEPTKPSESTTTNDDNNEEETVNDDNNEEEEDNSEESTNEDNEEEQEDEPVVKSSPPPGLDAKIMHPPEAEPSSDSQ